MGGGGVEVFAVVQRLFAQWSAFAQGARDGVHRGAETGVIVRRAVGKGLLRRGQIRLLPVADIFLAGQVVADAGEAGGDFGGVQALACECGGVVADEHDQSIQRAM